MNVLTEKEKTNMIAAMMVAFDCIERNKPEEYSRPQLFIQYPCSGTHAVVYLKNILHPSETVGCMDVIHEQLIKAGFKDSCIVAASLTELEINL